MPITQRDVTWRFSEEAAADVRDVRADLGDKYRASVSALRDFLCGYFTMDSGCSAPLGKTISPMGSTKAGGKMLKVRWTLPGSGKSGGLRLAVVAFCNERKVILSRGFIRKDDPSDSDFEGAGELADNYRLDVAPLSSDEPKG